MSVIIKPLHYQEFVQVVQPLVEEKFKSRVQTINHNIPKYKFKCISGWYYLLSFLCLFLFLIGLVMFLVSCLFRCQIKKYYNKQLQTIIIDLYAGFFQQHLKYQIKNQSLVSSHNQRIDLYASNLGFTPADLFNYSLSYLFHLREGGQIRMSTSSYFVKNDNNTYKKIQLGLINLQLPEFLTKQDFPYQFNLFQRINHQLTKVKLENNEFNKRIGMWANDLIKARMTATPLAMEVLLEHFKNNLNNKQIWVNKKETEIDIAFIPYHAGLFSLDLKISANLEKVLASVLKDIIRDLYEIYSLLAIVTIFPYVY